MKISFTKDEYKSLLDIFHMATWVLYANNNEKSEDKAKYDVLEQKILKLATEFGYEKYVNYEAKDSAYIYSDEFEKVSLSKKFIEEFEDETFWDEITTRLTRRDMVKKHGLETIKAMDLVGRIKEESAIGKKYYDEFVKNGLNNLTLGNK